MSSQMEMIEGEPEAVTLNMGRIEADTTLKYPHNFWYAYKGHVRGMLTGTALGGGIGALIGLACAPFTGGLSVPLMVGVGILVGAEKAGSIGSSAGVSAAGLAEKHARLRDPANEGNLLKANTDMLMYAGHGHHYEFPPHRDRKKLFHWKSGLVGAVIGIAAGALIGVGGIPALITLFPAIGALGLASALSAAAWAVPAISATIFGLFGLSFGIERGIFKSIFNGISFLTDERNNDYDNGVDLGLQQEMAKGYTEEQVMQRRLERQEDIHKLQEEYDQQIFASSARSYIKGGTGGAIVGGLVGLAVGAIALGLVAVTHIIALPAMPLLIPAAFAIGFGMYFGETYAETGKLAGTEASARAINDEFERKQALKAQGIDCSEPEAPSKPLFNLGTGITMGVLGAGIAAVVAPALLPALLGTTPVIGGLIVHEVITGLGYGVMAIGGGILGLLTGFSDHVLHGIARTTNQIYYKTYSGNPDEDDKLRAAPQAARAPSQDYGYARENMATVTPEEAGILAARLKEGRNNNAGFVSALYNQNKPDNLELGI